MKDLLRYPLGREGVYGPGVNAFLAHTEQKVSNIVDLTALRLAFFMGNEYELITFPPLLDRPTILLTFCSV